MKKDTNDYIEKEFSGIITDIRCKENNRGTIDILIIDKWINLGNYGDRISKYIQIKDSIVKKSNTKEIRVYHLNSKGVWNEKIFK
ncbi:MAG: hypothetical protein K9J13_11550 [Saprospiraceae bacterium]|nr:hypothetical protein [Saprospiraceae bacterium]